SKRVSLREGRVDRVRPASSWSERVARLANDRFGGDRPPAASPRSRLFNGWRPATGAAGQRRAQGVAGVKIDFFDHEAKEVIDLYQALLRETAEHHLLVNFHGSNKPTGESRTRARKPFGTFRT